MRTAATTAAAPGGPALAAVVLALALAAAGAAGCRGTASESAPIHLNPNMDDQDYVEAQEPFAFFADGRGMRPPVPGTVRRGATPSQRTDILREDDHLYRGRQPGTGGEDFATTLPVPLTPTLLARGRERYAIYCALCHDGTGGGDGPVVRRGMVEPPPFDDQRLLAMPVGQLFDVVTNGARNMPPYAAQIPVADRWAIVAYVRALQLARSATLDDVPPDLARERGWEAAP
jgi:hypothetical protein